MVLAPVGPGQPGVLRRPARHAPGAARARARELLASVGLAEAADRRFDRYSSGMRAPLSLARALLCELPVLLFDEPTRTLDPLAATSFRDEVRAQAGAGRAVLFAVGGHQISRSAINESRAELNR